MIRTATRDDAVYVGRRLRRADWQELWAAHNNDVVQTVVTSVEISDESWVLECGGDPFCIWGIGTNEQMKCGVPWMVGTGHMWKHKRDTLGVSRVMLDYYHTKHRTLMNCTDVRHTESHRYLKWLGFKFYPAIPFGDSQLPFYPFMRVADV
jgi:hypothetical protein